MARDETSTRVVTFFFSDIEGSTRLAQALGGDWGAVLDGHRMVMRRAFEHHRGREMSAEGDSFFAVFDDPIDAIAAAAEAQTSLGDETDGGRVVPVLVRIGLHAGPATRHGDRYVGVEIHRAARIAAAGHGGQILVSEAIRGLVVDRLGQGAALRRLGEYQLKDFDTPQTVYQLTAPGLPDGFPPLKVAAIDAALALPEKPSIVVLPFANLSGDPEQEYFADGMVEEITTALARIRWIFVIARNSAFTYRGRAVDVKQVGRELGVRYVLEGSVRKGTTRVRITAQLIDTTNGAHLWADKFDGSLEDVFELQDKVAISVAGVIEPTLRQTEIERARRKRPDSLDAYDLFLRALPHAFAAMPEDADKALALLLKAVDMEPDFAAAHALIAWCEEQRYLRGGLHEESRNAALRHARRAMAAGSDDAAALATAAFVIAAAGRDYESAFAAFDRSFVLSSSSALALGFSSLVRAWTGDEAAAIEHADRALRLSPFDPLIYIPYVALAYVHFAAGRFEEAAAAASLASQSNPRFSVPHMLHAAALRSLDRTQDAGRAVERLLELQPGTTVATAILSARYTNPRSIDALANALRRAGLPEA